MLETRVFKCTLPILSVGNGLKQKAWDIWVGFQNLFWTHVGLFIFDKGLLSED